MQAARPLETALAHFAVSAAEKKRREQTCVLLKLFAPMCVSFIPSTAARTCFDA